MDIGEYLSTYKHDSKPYYTKLFKLWREKVDTSGTVAQRMLKDLEDMLVRGKMLRGALACLGYEIANGKDAKAMLHASVLMELTQTSVLILDDICDEDTVRRGVPCVHRRWSPTGAKYGNDMAMLTGLFGLHLGPGWLLNADFSAQVMVTALQLYFDGMNQTVVGEAMDISCTATQEQDQQTAAMIHYYKTVQYSLVLPLRFGAALAAAPQALDQDLTQFAQVAGKMYQARDDYLGTFGDPSVMGKSNRQDLAQARWTLLVEILKKESSKADWQRVAALLAQPQRDKNEIEELAQCMKQYRVEEKTLEHIAAIRTKAQAQLDTMQLSQRHTQILTSLLTWLEQRQK